MAVYENTSGQARTWLQITHPETGQTLHLEPGEKVNLDLPDEFEDAHLKPAAKGQPKRKTTKRTATKPKTARTPPASADTTPTSEEQ